MHGDRRWRWRWRRRWRRWWWRRWRWRRWRWRWRRRDQVLVALGQRKILGEVAGAHAQTGAVMDQVPARVHHVPRFGGVGHAHRRIGGACQTGRCAQDGGNGNSDFFFVFHFFPFPIEKFWDRGAKRPPSCQQFHIH
ncbi:hypothetical protein SBBP2_190025 [Burkholderiales bacterium]|nr:hypothetical protein SBBP2_190025 [Burkholderiales bacterium]